jgi:hypothetical protein
VVTTLHLPRRPLWACMACETAWPCAPAQAELVTSYAGMPVSLSIFVAGQFVLALDDLSRVDGGNPPDPRALFERFFCVVPVARGVEPCG